MRYTSAVQVNAFVFLLAYVLSNAVAFREVQLFYFSKHLAVIGLAVLGILRLLVMGKVRGRKRHLFFVGTVGALALPYLLRFIVTQNSVEILAFWQYLVFGLAAVVLASALEDAGRPIVSRIVLSVLTAVALVALCAALIDLNQLYNTYWGRPRLLLGFWHPKEVGALITSAALLIVTSAALGVRRKRNILLYLTLVSVLFFIDSRNMFLFSLLFPLAYLTATFGSYYLLGVLVTLGAWTVAWFITTYPELADLLLSFRLTLWRSAEYSFFGSGTRLKEAEGTMMAKFNIDNFYLEYLVENGVYVVVLVVAVPALIGYLVRVTPQPEWRRLKISAALAFLFASAFDAGMFSTGNFYHLTVWVYLLAGERIFGTGNSVASSARSLYRVAPSTLTRSTACAGEAYGPAR